MKPSREHGVINAHSVRIVGLDPEHAHEVIREEEDFRYALLASSLEPPMVQVRIGETPIGLLANGLGANWSPPIQGEEAFPDDADEQGWRQVFAAMDYAGITWVRYWLEPLGLLQDGKVVTDHRFFSRLDRLQQWASAAGATIMLEFSAIPTEFRGDEVHDAPADNRHYVDAYLLPILRHVVLERGCARIRQVCLYNEPFNADVTPYLFLPPQGQDPLEYYVALHEYLREAMDAAGMRDVGLIGPNSANLFQRHIEMFEDKGLAPRVMRTFAELDVHMWRMRYDYYPPSKRWPGYTLSEGIDRYLRPTLAAARRLGKTLSLTETGAMYFNENPRSSRVTQHDAFLLMAEQIVRSLNEGIAGAMVWAFTNSGHVDGRWGWIGTRDERFAPVPHLLHGFATLMRYHRVGAQILPCTIQRSDYSSFISAAALTLPDGNRTLYLVNDHPVEKINVTIHQPSPADARPLSVFRKDFDPERKLVTVIEDAGTIELMLPGMSLTTLTTIAEKG